MPNQNNLIWILRTHYNDLRFEIAGWRNMFTIEKTIHKTQIVAQIARADQILQEDCAPAVLAIAISSLTNSKKSRRQESKNTEQNHFPITSRNFLALCFVLSSGLFLCNTSSMKTMTINNCVRPNLNLVGGNHHHNNDYFSDFNGIGLPRSRTPSTPNGGTSNNNTNGMFGRSRSVGKERLFLGGASTPTMNRHRSTPVNKGRSLHGATTPIASNKKGYNNTVDRMSKESLLYKKNRSRSNQTMGISKTEQKLREAQEFLEWKEHRSRSAGKLRSYAHEKSAPSSVEHQQRRPTTPKKRQASSPQRNLSATSPRRLRPTTPTRQSPKASHHQPQAPSSPTNRQITLTRQRQNKKERSFDLRQLQQQATNNPPSLSYSDRIRQAMAAKGATSSTSRNSSSISDAQMMVMNQVDVKTLTMPKVDIISHRNNSSDNDSTGGGARSVVRPIFKSQLRSSGSGDSSIPIYDPSVTPKYFEENQSKKKKKKKNPSRYESNKESTEQHRCHSSIEADDDNFDWRPDESKPSIDTPGETDFWNIFGRSTSNNMDAVEKFRDNYKDEDKNEPVSGVIAMPAVGAADIIYAKISDLSASTDAQNNSTTIKSPRRKNQPYNQFNNNHTPLQAANSIPIIKSVPNPTTPKNKRTLKLRVTQDALSVDSNGIPKCKSTGYSGPLSPSSDVGDDGDRYTMFLDDNDEFDDAVRHRLFHEQAAGVKKSAATPSSKISGGDLSNKSPIARPVDTRHNISKSPRQLNHTRSTSRGRDRSKTPTNKSPRQLPFGQRDEQAARADQEEKKLLSRKRFLERKGLVNAGGVNHHHNPASMGKSGESTVRGQTGRLLPKRRPTPGLALGQSRSYVDQVEERLTELKHKRQLQEQLYGISPGHSSFNSSANQNTSSRQGKSELPELNLGRAATPNAKKGKKKLGVKKLLGALTGGGRDEKRRPMLNMQTSTENPINADGGEMMGMFHTLEEEHTIGYQHEAKGLTKQQEIVANNGVIEIQNRDETESGRHSNLSDRVSSLFRFRKSSRQEMGQRAESVQGNNTEDIVSTDADTSNGNRDDSSSDQPLVVADKVTSYDSAIDRESLQVDIQTEPEFAVVELGEDENTIHTHSILVNTNDVKFQLTSPKEVHHDQSQENKPFTANSPKQFRFPSPTPKHVKDDNKIDDMQVTVSFQDQLHQLKALKRQPSKARQASFDL